MRLIYLGIGWLFVGLGVLGVFLPLLPTTPFLLVALWAFSRSSEQLADRLRTHPRFGALIRAWQDNGVIPLKAKALSLSMMTAMVIYTFGWSHAPRWAAVLMAITLAAVGCYIITRPSRPPEG